PASLLCRRSYSEKRRVAEKYLLFALVTCDSRSPARLRRRLQAGISKPQPINPSMTYADYFTLLPGRAWACYRVRLFGGDHKLVGQQAFAHGSDRPKQPHAQAYPPAPGRARK